MITKYIKKNLKNISGVNKDLLRQNILCIDSRQGDDIYIASYPKSGVTWLQHALCGMIYGMDVRLTPDSLVNMLIPDTHSNKYYLRTGRPVVFKTHALPQKNMKRVIHLVRDGRDVLASYHAMMKNLGRKISLKEMIIDKKGLFPCDWGTHARNWMSNPYNAEIIRISYEELKKEDGETFKKIASFIGVQLSDERIAEIVEQSKFEEMQKKEIKMGWGNGHVMKEGLFIRKGKVGSYKEEITEELTVFFENENADILKKLGY